MGKSIEELLHRRTDLSTFLVHLTRDTDEESALTVLLRIISELELVAAESRSFVRNWLAGKNAPQVEDRDELLDSQSVVCFTETPLEHTWMMCEEIVGRGVDLAPYGIAITKTSARSRGVNPVWYIDQTPSGRDWLSNRVRSIMTDAYSSTASTFRRGRNHPIFAVTPFFDTMTPGWEAGRRKEFWWEREWRHAGDFAIELADVVAFFAPETDHKEVEEAAAVVSPDRAIPVLDPVWGLERMIVALSGVQEG